MRLLLLFETAAIESKEGSVNDSIRSEKKLPPDRPVFPKRAVITAGMPYGNKSLHFGHIGGVFIHADIFARFLRDRIGKDNVIFVSGTDCYGSSIVEDYRILRANNRSHGSIADFVRANHISQCKVLKAYQIQSNLFAASSFGRAAEIHEQMCNRITQSLHKNGYLEKRETEQFYDVKQDTFLNGRQVQGKCPILGCSSEKAYADECSLGHQYEPRDLINPVSTLSGVAPQMRKVTNWYFQLPEFRHLLRDWIKEIAGRPWSRQFMVNAIGEFLELPIIYVKEDILPRIEAEFDEFPAYTLRESKSESIGLVFDNLDKRENACSQLAGRGIRYRTGKTLVPFRLTGNNEWGLPARELDGLKGLTYWVWPESLIAPISFTSAYLEQQGADPEGWKAWWCSKESQVYQFIGEDNIFFYGPAEMAMFMGMQGADPKPDPDDGQLQLPVLIVNKHLLFLNKKASSSGSIKPPMAEDLLNHYTADQLRAHFFSLGLGLQNVSFQPKPLNPAANISAGDPVMKEGNLISNVLNRAVRSCFYTAQKYYDGKIPVGDVSAGIKEDADNAILEYEHHMYTHEFHLVMETMDKYIRGITKHWAKKVQNCKTEDARRQGLIDSFHMVRVATVLMHPIAPQGTEMVCRYLNIGEEFWDWNRIFDPLYSFMNNPEEHKFKALQPRVDFFEKHPSQIKTGA